MTKEGANSSGLIGGGTIEPQQLVRMLFFIELINGGSISKAAETMGISISTGSRWLGDLENELGITLYQRNNPNERLTEAGMFLYEKFSDITNDIHLMLNELSKFTSEPRGNIKVCCTPVYAESVVLPIIGEFVEANPLVNIELTLTPRGLDYHHDHDFIISAIAGVASDKDSELLLTRKNLITERFITVASPEYIRKHGEPKVPSELNNHRCLFSNTLQNQKQWVYKQNGKQVPIEIMKWIELSDAKMMLSAALNSTGITYLPEFIVKRHIDSGKLVKILDEYETDNWLLNIYYLPPKFMTHCAKSFKEYFLSRYSEKLIEFKSSN
ncbi:LysR family transcriptional regulator [Vibrio sp. HN007]|uniref:LysR family transcriptional regulator n=1 Tax=Vibrio iocasae TaxID=3098914 RepID=UPI0035D49C0A